MIAEGAGHFRQPGLLERIARRLSAVPMSDKLRARLKTYYVAALSSQTRGRGLPASLPGGEIIRVLPEFSHIGWNPDEYRAFRDVVRPEMTALDIGANVGAYTLLLGQWVGSAGSVHAFEPAPAAYDGLVRHIALNELTNVIRPVPSAVGASLSTAALLAGGPHGENRFAAAREGSRSTITVPVTTIDSYCSRLGLNPAFIKIDVEGAELDVLRGARETIRRCRGRLALFVEWHPSIWPAIGVTRQQIEAELIAQSLAVEPLVATADVWALEGMCVRLVSR